MIYTVTINPAIDKTIVLKYLKSGALNRVQKSLTNIGGKGINVSFVLKALGGESTALGLAGGENGRQIVQGLCEAHIENHFLETGKESRTNIKIVESDGTLTELNEAGVGVGQEMAEAFRSLVRMHIASGDILVLSGSVPEGVPSTIYRDLTLLAHKKGAKVILDADGELFSYGIEAVPDVIKPNEEELRRYISAQKNTELESIPEKLQHGKQIWQFLKCGIHQVILSKGGEGACFYEAGAAGYTTCPALPIEVHSTVGAGDAMVAAWAYAMDKGLTGKEAIRLSMAASAAAASTPGTAPPAIERIRELENQVQLKTENFKSVF